MRALACAALAAAAIGCDNSACHGVDGTCVSLTVAGEGSVDGVQLTVSGAATGTRVAPAVADVERLPVEIALQPPSAANGPLHIDAVGVLYGTVVGSGSVDVTVSPGAHTSARVTLSLTGSAPDGGADLAPGPPVDVTGSAVTHYVLGDGGVVDVPVDFTKVALGAAVESGGSFTTIAVQGDASGHLALHAPSTPYYLRFGSRWLFGSTATPDLSAWALGRPDQTHASKTTTLSFSVTNLAAWNANDTLQLFSVNAGTELFDLEGDLKPATNATTLGGSLNLSLYPFGMLIDGAKGDDTMLLQLVADSDSGVAYQRLGKLATFSRFTIADGGSANLSAAMSDVAKSSSLPIAWGRSQFAQYATAVNPNASGADDLFDLFAQPGGVAGGPFSSTPDLVVVRPPSGTSDVGMTVGYGNPFPASWTLVAATASNFAVSYTAPGATAGSFDGAIWTYATVDQLPSPIVPLVSPVQRPLINGKSAFSPQTSASATPLISWSPPLFGAPSSYALYLYAVDNSLGATTLDFVSALYTASTSVRVPPGMLVGGQSYFVVISALAGGADASVSPFLQPLPSGWADTLSAAFTVVAPQTADGASCKAILAAHPGSPDGVYVVDGGGGTPFTTFCDMTTDGGGWTLVGKIDGRAAISSEWLVQAVNPGQLASPTIESGMIACVDAVSFAVNAAKEIRLANSARSKWVKWTLPAGRTTATWWQHSAGQAVINAAAQSSVSVSSSTGGGGTCYQNIYGILPFSAHGGSYPSAAGNATGNTTPGDWCLSVGTTLPNSTVDGFTQNGNGWDAPASEGDWPNAAYNVPAHLSVWLR